MIPFINVAGRRNVVFNFQRDPIGDLRGFGRGTAWLRWRVIAAEERHMIRQFGQAYLDYQAKVPRWL